MRELNTVGDNRIMRAYRLPCSLVEAIDRYAKRTGITATAVIERGASKVVGAKAGASRKRRHPT